MEKKTTYRRQKLNKNVEEFPPRKGSAGFFQRYFKQKDARSFRTVHGHVTGLGRTFALQENEFCSNCLRMSKYTTATFVPLNLFHQLSHPANLYFLFIAFLQLLPGLSPTSWMTTVVPLSCMLLLNGLKDGYYDWRHHQSDRKVNYTMTEILIDDMFESHTWESVIVGDLLKVNIDEEFPADMVFLCSSDSQGLAYVETTNFDGDSHLKTRNAIYQTVFKDFNMSPSIFSGLVIKCEHPNNRLYEFDGVIKLQGTGRMILDETKILLRGSTLRSTSWVLGSVIFTGRDTKVVRNMISTSRKVSKIESHVNTIIPIRLVGMIVICISLALAGNNHLQKHTNEYYIPIISAWPDYGIGFKGTCVGFIRFLILLHEAVPISLYMSLELVKVAQCFFVDWDLHMYYAADDRPALARATGLLEELGQVEYVLADKTGTLTQNVMAFVSCSIGGVSYGKKSKMADQLAVTSKSTGSVHLIAQDDALKNTITSNSNIGRLCCDFFTHLALCHNVYPRYADKESTIKYQAASPDESALVQGAAECGFHLESRSAEEIILFLEGVGLERYAILAVLDFTWDRKRMSVICRSQHGRLKLYCKGADSAILKRLRGSDSSSVEATVQHIEQFSRNGYRTLCIAERELSEKEFETWAGRFLGPSTSADDRQAQLAIAAETIERDMVLLGATAVEDKLQEGVAETVTLLAQAGIRIWVLTGDKLESSVTISLSCNLLADSMHLFLLPDTIGKFLGQMLENMLDEARRHYEAILNEEGFVHSDMALVIEGHSLAIALEHGNREAFLKLCQLCRTVICCRVSPMQKVQVTRLVRSYGFMVAAVGDGANDVGMIKAAQIGVGIHGREGNAAVAASDYSIAQFRFLARLILVHGRWSYLRNKDLALYTMYKNLVYVMANFYFSFFSAYSAQSIYPGMLLSTYDVLWTLLPIVTVAILKRDVSHCTAENNPQLYMETQVGGTYKFAADVLQWTLSAIWHSIVAFFLPLVVIHTTEADGETMRIWSFGATVYIMAVVIVSVKLAVHEPSWILLQILVLCGAISSLFICLLLMSVISSANDISEDLDTLGYELFCKPNFWLLLILSPMVACLPDIAYVIFGQRSRPADATILREIEHGWRDGEYIRGSPDIVGRITVPAKLSIDGDAEAEELEDENDVDDIFHPALVAGTVARRKTWRELVNDERFDAMDHVNAVTWDGKRKSSGFQMVTRLSAPQRKPRPLQAGPIPPYRISAKQSTLGLDTIIMAKEEGYLPTTEPKTKASRKRWKNLALTILRKPCAMLARKHRNPSEVDMDLEGEPKSIDVSKWKTRRKFSRWEGISQRTQKAHYGEPQLETNLESKPAPAEKKKSILRTSKWKGHRAGHVMISSYVKTVNPDRLPGPSKESHTELGVNNFPRHVNTRTIADEKPITNPSSSTYPTRPRSA